MTLTDIVRLAARHTYCNSLCFLGPDTKTIMETVERTAKMGGASLLTGADLVARVRNSLGLHKRPILVFNYQVTFGGGETSRSHAGNSA